MSLFGPVEFPDVTSDVYPAPYDNSVFVFHIHMATAGQPTSHSITRLRLATT